MPMSGVSPGEEMEKAVFYLHWGSLPSRMEFDKKAIRTPSLQEELDPPRAGRRIISILPSPQSS